MKIGNNNKKCHKKINAKAAGFMAAAIAAISTTTTIVAPIFTPMVYAEEAIELIDPSEEDPELKEEKTLTRTIRYYYLDIRGEKQNVLDRDTGEPFVIEQSDTRTRRRYENRQGEKVFENWPTFSFKEVITPKLEGYTPDKEKIEAVEFEVDSVPKDEEVIYKLTDSPIGSGGAVTPGSSNLVSETTEIVRTIRYMEKRDDGSIVPIPAEDGTNLETRQYATFTRFQYIDKNGKIKYTDWSTVEFEAIPSHEIAGYVADIKEVPEVTVSPDNPPENVTVLYTRDGSSDNNTIISAPISEPDSYLQTETLIRTIHFVKKEPDGTIVPVTNSSGERMQVTQTVNFSRTGYKSSRSGKIIYGEWKEAVLPEVDVIKVSGYTPDMAKVASVECTPDDPPEDVTVTYTRRLHFDDVNNSSSPFYTPIYWAAEHGVTTGVTDTLFKPDDTCTRGQAVTFLWRIFGKPSPKDTTNPFSDVKQSSAFYNAILWASQQGITTGFDDGTFRQDEECTRGQIVTFIWRAAGAKKSDAQNKFKDVIKEGNKFYDAILWAIGKNVTTGFDDGTFRQDANCTRAQIVTFLYRYFA